MTVKILFLGGDCFSHLPFGILMGTIELEWLNMVESNKNLECVIIIILFTCSIHFIDLQNQWYFLCP
jgi:hypothetical protein